MKWTIGFFEPGEKQKSLHNKPKVMMKKNIKFLMLKQFIKVTFTIINITKIELSFGKLYKNRNCKQ